MPTFAAVRSLFSTRRATDPAQILRRALEHDSVRKGPPAIAAARAQCGQRPDILIAPLETRFGLIGDRIAVRAWVLLSEADQSPDLREVARRSMSAFADNGRMADVFFLSAAYGLRTDDIATLLGISRRKVRKLLFGAIARIDRAFAGYTPASVSDGSTESKS